MTPIAGGEVVVEGGIVADGVVVGGVVGGGVGGSVVTSTAGGVVTGGITSIAPGLVVYESGAPKIAWRVATTTPSGSKIKFTAMIRAISNDTVAFVRLRKTELSLLPGSGFLIFESIEISPIP